eukprot:Nitzschia sp. Nitz4//scaffold51_size120721//1612//3488//NITZ4_003711-RA/size120721-snap-gene-0.30-mRNA-1//-1//CDS//3329553814//3352//frame0
MPILTQQRKDKWMYRILGPSTAHMKHEFYLWVSMVFLTIANLQSIYQKAFGTTGDWVFLFLVALYLSQHVFLRWICAGDISTHKSPTFLGAIGCFITSWVMSGQYFDRPPASYVAKQVGTPTAEERLRTSLPQPLVYTWQLLKIRLWYPLLTLLERLGKMVGVKIVSERDIGKKRSPPRNRYNSKVIHYWNIFQNHYCPSSQLVLVILAGTLYCWFFFFGNCQYESPHDLTSKGGEDSEPIEETKTPFGAYRRILMPHWTQILLFFSFGSVQVCLICFARIFFPIVDLLAGGQVIKSIRNDGRWAHSSQKSSKSRPQQTAISEQVSWAERYVPLALQNRFDTLIVTTEFRIIEAVWICATFPRTECVCKFTGHCPTKFEVGFLSKLIFPVGVTTPLREDMWRRDSASPMSMDWGSTVLIFLSVAVVSATILIAQIVTLNRSYLGITGYVTGGWAKVDPSLPSLEGIPKQQWDHKVRYKKGDVVTCTASGWFGSATTYQATSNSPEGKPWDWFFYAASYLFRNEIGHPSTSTLIKNACLAQMVLVGLTVWMTVYYYFGEYNTASLLWTLAANLVAAYGTLHMTIPAHSEFATLAQEIAGKSN